MSQGRVNWGDNEPPERDQSLPALIKLTIHQTIDLLKAEVELVKAKAIRAGKKLAVSIAFFTLAAFLGVFLLWWLFHSVELAFTLILPQWAASLITAGILFVLMIICALIGFGLAKAANRDKPPVHQLIDEDAQILKEGFGQ